MHRFDPPNATERWFNRLFGAAVALGVGPSYSYLLEVRGRTSGRTYATPISLLVLDGRRYVVAPRGHTQWVRNALAARTVTLRRGRRRDEFGVRALTTEETPAVLRAYLDRFTRAVQRYFPVPAGSSLDAFRPLVERYPAFELVPRR
jgi:deazaflavin-dependent oxidoreductase (nitroreductase family)